LKKQNISLTLQCKGLVIYHTSKTAKIIFYDRCHVNPCAPLQGDSLWKSEKHFPLHCIYGFA